jgi:sensor histidine kinase YesM
MYAFTENIGTTVLRPTVQSSLWRWSERRTCWLRFERTPRLAVDIFSTYTSNSLHVIDCFFSFAMWLFKLSYVKYTIVTPFLRTLYLLVKAAVSLYILTAFPFLRSVWPILWVWIQIIPSSSWLAKYTAYHNVLCALFFILINSKRSLKKM